MKKYRNTKKQNTEILKAPAAKMIVRLVFGLVLFLSPIRAFSFTFTLSTSIKLDKVIASLDHDRHHDDRDDDILLIKLMMGNE